jgi:hypothetical protein
MIGHTFLKGFFSLSKISRLETAKTKFRLLPTIIRQNQFPHVSQRFLSCQKKFPGRKPQFPKQPVSPRLKDHQIKIPFRTKPRGIQRLCSKFFSGISGSVWKCLVCVPYVFNANTMTVSTTINSTEGVVSTINDEDQGVVRITGLQYPIIDLTTAATISAKQAGSFTFGNGSAPVTYVMPLASSCPGAMFIFRSKTAYANALTCSQEANGTLAFTDGENRGSRLAVAAMVGSSVALVSDGTSFLLLGASGSGAISGT